MNDGYRAITNLLLLLKQKYGIAIDLHSIPQQKLVVFRQ